MPSGDLIFTAALISRSWLAPQNRQVHSRIDSSFLPPISLQHEQRWLVGSHLLMMRNSRPYFWAFPSRNVLNCRHPKSLIARDNLQFLTMPATFKSSRITAWFSRINLVDNLCRKSVLVSLSLAYCLALRRCAFSYRLEPRCFLARFLSNRLTR